MAGRPGVTRAEVAAAMQALRERGDRVSAVAVRGALGRGSFTTIGRHLREVRAEEDELGLASGDGRDMLVPDPIARSLLAGAQTFWLELSQAADAIVEEAELRARERIAEAQAMEQAARRDVEAVRKERNREAAARAALSTELEDLQRSHAGVVEQLRGAIGERDRLTQRLDGAEALSEERSSALVDAKQLIGELRAEITEAGRRGDAARTAHEAALAKFQSRLDATTTELAQAALEREALETELRGLREVREAEGARRAELEAALERLQVVLGDERDARSRIEAERSEFAGRSEVLERSVARLEGIVSGYRGLSGSVTDQFERIFGELAGVANRVNDVLRMASQASTDRPVSSDMPRSSHREDG